MYELNNLSKASIGQSCAPCIPPARPSSDIFELKTGKSLKAARRQRGLSQIDLADLLAVSQSRISAWENGYDDIPRQQKLKMIDILTNRKGAIDPFLKHLIKTDPNLVIYAQEFEDGVPNLRYLHVSPELASQFFPANTDLIKKRPADIGQNGLKEDEFFKVAKMQGRGISKNILAMDVERDVPAIGVGAVSKPLRLMSRQTAVEFEGYSKLIVTRYEICGAGVGEKPKLHNQLFLEELDTL